MFRKYNFQKNNFWLLFLKFKARYYKNKSLLRNNANLKFPSFNEKRVLEIFNRIKEVDKKYSSLKLTFLNDQILVIRKN